MDSLVTLITNSVIIAACRGKLLLHDGGLGIIQCRLIVWDLLATVEVDWMSFRRLLDSNGCGWASHFAHSARR